MAFKRYLRNALSALAVFSTAIAGVAIAGRASEPLNVVTTTSMIADAAKAVGGKFVTVKSLIAANIDPHSYRPTRSDIVALSKAKLILWNGLELEEQLEKNMESLAKKTTVIAVAEKLPESQLLEMAEEEEHDDHGHGHGHKHKHEHKHEHGAEDPHVWMSPRVWSGVVEIIRDAMVKAQPANADAFKSNAAGYLKQLAELDSYSKKVLSSVPENSRVLMTAHDAFNYFGKAYGYQVIGIQGLSTLTEPGLKRIADMAKMLADRKISAIFVEASVADNNVRAVIEGAGALGQKVVLGGELFSGSMGKPGTYEGTYIGMIDHNVTTISRALGGTAPAKGMNGKLSGLAG